MTPPIIFLDVDGVLNTGRRLHGVNRGKSRPFDPEAVCALNHVLRETSAKIVVSSTWRYLYKPHEFDELLFLEGMPRGLVIGATPPTIGDRRRGGDIAAWLAQNPEHTNYVVIDDDSDMDGIDRTRFFQCDFMVGLTMDLAELVIARLRQ